jgi:DNA-binding YbaB/EbfC family protein
MGSGFSKMKKQARLMQNQFSQMKEKMETTLVEGSAGAGLVTVVLNGSKELKKIIIKPECASDVEGLQDLILGAFEDANQKLANQSQAPGTLPW